MQITKQNKVNHIWDFKIDVHGKPQAPNFKYFKAISTRLRLPIHAWILLYHTVQIVLNSSTKLLKTKYNLKFAVCG